ncbi:hypothetical protein TRAPUB_6399 [Trametes pubescens]|uniref:F-box domain-containing protein n=1 Tax=Trametes pubescens TaxID=154538 RepID=A0A1M2V6F0_TRAPU|nr:hypothetical protein TRAPUB_6399 [Trametes pubescens]
MERNSALSADVMLVIASFASRATLSALMKTCRLLYHEGAKMLVRRRVEIGDVRDLSSFLAFLHAEEGSRCAFLRDLVLDIDLPRPTTPNPMSPALSNLLANHSFRSLTSLRLVGAERVLRSHPKLAAGFASLKALTSLDIGPVGPKTLSVLVALESELRVLVLKYAPGLDQRPSAAECCHPVVVLQRFKDSLETLDVQGYEAELDRALFTEPYPRMQELILDSPDCPLFAPYIHAFPDMRNLSITTVFADNLTRDNLYVEEDLIEAFRRANRGDQAVYGSWTKLETVNGTAPDLYVAGLRCAIKDLYLNVCLWDPFKMVLGTLQDASVSRLHLFVHAIDALQGCGLPMVFKRLVDSSLEALFLHIRLCAEEEWDEDLRAVVDPAALVSMLRLGAGQF